MNDIAKISFKLAQPVMVDSYTNNRATGAFIVIDESTNNTVGAGMIIWFALNPLDKNTLK